MTTVHKRVLKDITDGRTALKKEFGIYLEPEESDFYKVHFVLPGPEDTPFSGGLYHGMIRLNENHPYKPPNIHMITPNGRFVAEGCPIPNGSRGICTTTSSFHPETWTPMNNLETVIKGFVSLMCDPFDGGVGGIKSTEAEMKKLARESINHIKTDIYVKNLFPDLYNTVLNGKYQAPNLGELSVKKKSENKIVVVDDFDEDTKKEKNRTLKKPSKPDTDEDSWGETQPIKPTKNKTVAKKKPVKKISHDDSDAESDNDSDSVPKRGKTKTIKKNDSDDSNSESETDDKPKKTSKASKKIISKNSKKTIK